MKVKKVILAGVMAASIVTVFAPGIKADAINITKSSGRIEYDNHTPQTVDDVIFDAADFLTLEKMIKAVEAKIAAAEAAY